jgi:tetratricopeptide (TPR) repeat protein
MAEPAAAPLWFLDADLAAQKSNEAVAVAAEKCAGDTKGQTCYICTEALHWKTKEGLVRMCACRGTSGFAHVSCLAEQAKILCAEAEENNKVSQWHRWHTCSLCEQKYHGDVACAIGWACWKTYLGRPEVDELRRMGMAQLGNGLSRAEHYEDALSVMEAELATLRRVGASEANILGLQTNLACTYGELGRLEEASNMFHDVYSGRLRLYGEEHLSTLRAALNCAASLNEQERFEEANSLMRKMMPVARRVFGENHEFTLRMRSIYARTLYDDPAATLDDLREAVALLEDTDRIARRVFGGAHPTTAGIERHLRNARAILSIHEHAPTCVAIFAAAALALAAAYLARKKLT